jgi:uncharacterized protein YijF (DUF1287 family)
MFPLLPELVQLESDQHLGIYTFSATQMQPHNLRRWALAQMARLYAFQSAYQQTPRKKKIKNKDKNLKHAKIRDIKTKCDKTEKKKPEGKPNKNGNKS